MDAHILGAAAGTYLVAYRGAESDNYAVQLPDNTWNSKGNYTGYPYILVVINPSKLDITQLPEDAKLVYNGEARLPFIPGYGTDSSGRQVNLVYSYERNSDNYLSADSPELLQTNAGIFVVYYYAKSNSESEKDSEIYSLNVEIKKAPITVTAPRFYESSTDPASVNFTPYNAQNYAPIGTELTFTIQGYNGAINNDPEKIGQIGDIYYAIAPVNSTPGNDAGFKKIEDVVAREAGEYDLFYRVYAGANHESSGIDARGNVEWQKFTTNRKFIISRAQAETVTLNWSQSTLGANDIRFNGREQILVTAGNLQLWINDALVEDAIGKVWYSLTTTPAVLPSDSELWEDSLAQVLQMRANTYYLHVKVEMGRNIEEKIGCVLYGSEPITININKAKGTDLMLSGIAMQSMMYRGYEVNLASGNLMARINGQLVTDWLGTQYYQYTDSNVDRPTSGWPEMDGLNQATKLNVGDYYLWVKLAESDNIEECILCVNPDGAVHIMPADETYINIVLPVLESKPYNGREQVMIATEAELRLKNDSVLGGIKGSAYYYIIPDDGTTIPSDEELGDWTRVWTKNYQQITELDRGTYLVYVRFESGTNHVALGPVSAGRVEITKANASTIDLSGITYKPAMPYNGVGQIIATGALTQTINGQVVTSGGITYAYSTSDTIKPADETDDHPWQTRVADVQPADAGRYYIWVHVQEDDKGNIEEYYKCVMVSDEHSNQFAEILVAEPGTVNMEGILARQGLKYNDEQQILVTFGRADADTAITDGTLTLTIDGNVVTSGSIYYAVSTLSGNQVDVNDLIWTQDLGMITAMNTGKYYLYVRVEESANIKKIVRQYCSIDIAMGYGEITAKPLAAGSLIYAHTDLQLLQKAGETNFGSMVYSLKDSPDLKTPADWTADLSAITGYDAGTYIVHFALLTTDNWYGISDIMSVEIEKAVASFVEAPIEKTQLTYTGEEFDLLSTFGILDPYASNQGCRLIYGYSQKDDPNGITYEYYETTGSLNVDELVYDWGKITGKLPGRTNAASDGLDPQGNAYKQSAYKIWYYVTASDKSTNYKQGEPVELTIEIKKREVYWLQEPQGISGLKNTGMKQPLITPGVLVGEDGNGAKVRYSTNYNSRSANWSEAIPEAHGVGVFYCWYRVDFDGNTSDNNYYLGPQNVMIPVLMETYTVSFRGDPQGLYLQYNAQDQALNWGGGLTLEEDGNDEGKPFIEYYQIDYKATEDDEYKTVTGWNSLDNNGQPLNPTGRAVGYYRVYYRVNYNGHADVYRFIGNDGHGNTDDNGNPQPLLYFESQIIATVISGNEIRAVFGKDSNGNHFLTCDYGNLSQEFSEELKDGIHFEYRCNQYLRDANGDVITVYNTGVWKACDENWYPQAGAIGTYQIRVVINGADGDNFMAYEQSDNFDEIDIKDDLVIHVEAQEYNTHPYLRVWVDLSGTMSYAESPFKIAGVSDLLVLKDVYTTGIMGTATIRVENTNSSYYYLSPEKSVTDKSTITLNAGLVDHTITSFNLNLAAKSTHLYVYEVYRITYSANGGSGSKPEGWKWHNVDYLLAENDLTHPSGLRANGWNTTSGGLGYSYHSGSYYYKTNASQMFYAEWRVPGENTYQIQWQITDGNLTYALSSAGEWFELTKATESRTQGMRVAEGAEIYLPQIESEGFSTAKVFGKMIMGWVASPDAETKYFPGRVADSDITFVAVLNNSSDDSVSCEFYDSENQIVGSTVSVANGAASYMALSGLTENEIRNYRTGYDQWIQEYDGQTLDGRNGQVFTYSLGDRMPDAAPKPQTNQNHEFTAMFIIILVGTIIAIALGVVYFTMRIKKTRLRLH